MPLAAHPEADAAGVRNGCESFVTAMSMSDMDIHKEFVATAIADADRAAPQYRHDQSCSCRAVQSDASSVHQGKPMNARG
jgi:hypothetical protein